MATNNHWSNQIRLGGLRRFAIAISILNLLGHTVLGFEQSFAHPLISLAAAYTAELVLEWSDARIRQRPPLYAGGVRAFIDFLLPAHITGLAVAMLLYANERLWPIAFASAAAIVSKSLLRVRSGQGTRHVLNPSNFGIALTLVLFPWVGIAQPYQFTEGLGAAGDWILPGIIVCSGSFLNWRFTRRLPLIGSWLTVFVLQAAVRTFLFGNSFAASLVPMTGVAFILFTFYMVTDPATTPSGTRSQVLFGSFTAIAYGALMAAHIVFGLFFALVIVCMVRGIAMYVTAFAAERQSMPAGIDGVVVARSRAAAGD
jgi:enediyne biosynthesis protein E5